MGIRRYLCIFEATCCPLENIYQLHGISGDQQRLQTSHEVYELWRSRAYKTELSLTLAGPPASTTGFPGTSTRIPRCQLFYQVYAVSGPGLSRLVEQFTLLCSINLLASREGYSVLSRSSFAHYSIFFQAFYPLPGQASRTLIFSQSRQGNPYRILLRQH